MIELGRYVTKKTMKSIAIIFDNFFSFPIVAMSNLRWFSKVFDTDRTYERLEKINIGKDTPYFFPELKLFFDK